MEGVPSLSLQWLNLGINVAVVVALLRMYFWMKKDTDIRIDEKLRQHDLNSQAHLDIRNDITDVRLSMKEYVVDSDKKRIAATAEVIKAFKDVARDIKNGD